MRRNFSGSALGVLLALASSQVSAAEVRDPAVLYQKFCSVCHGDQGDANTRAAGSLSPRPRNFTLPEAAAELTRERMIKSVAEGRPGTAMVGHSKKLNSKEIEAVVDHIRAKYMQAAVTPRQVPAMAQQGEGSAGGAAVYKKHCAPCHGDDGSASSWARNSLIPPPRDFTSAAARAELTKARMIKSVTQGRPGTAMQPFEGRLAPAEIESVVQHIRTRFMKLDEGGAAVAEAPAEQGSHPHRGPGAIPMTAPTAPANAGAAQAPADMRAPFPARLKGNPRSGEAFYMRNCVVCHGSSGDGNGPRAYFITPRPRNFTSDHSRQFYNRPQLFDAVTQGKRGTVMPAWGKVLDQQQIADVSEFVFQAYIRGTYKVTVRPDEEAKKKAN